MTAETPVKDENIVWHQHSVDKQFRAGLKSRSLRYFGLLGYLARANQRWQVHWKIA